MFFHVFESLPCSIWAQDLAEAVTTAYQLKQR